MVKNPNIWKFKRIFFLSPKNSENQKSKKKFKKIQKSFLKKSKKSIKKSKNSQKWSKIQKS